MKERVQEIPAKVVEFWNRYTSRQKTIIIAVICVVLVLIGVMAYLVSRPTWTRFQQFSNLDDASSMVKALDDEGIANKSSKDGLTLYVHDQDMTKAFYWMMHLTTAFPLQRVRRTKSVFLLCRVS